MQRVIVQIEGVGAYRVPASAAQTHREFAEADGWQYTDRKLPPDFYLVDGCGRTWAPLPDGAYTLWDR